jgi:pyruvate formate lyase activating enzyme
MTSSGPQIDRKLCDLCLVCVEKCPAGVYEAAGKTVTVDQVVEEINRDSIIYEESGGGVTLSGGEPFFQPEFLMTLLKMVNKRGIHTAIETCGHTSWQNIRQTLDYTDLYLFDLKLIDPGKCEKYLGVTGKLIQNNLEALVKANAVVQVRIPVIPGINDGMADIENISKVISDNGIETAELIPYHNLGTAKYRDLDLEYKLNGIDKPKTDSYKRFEDIFTRAGLKITCEVEEYND